MIPGSETPPCRQPWLAPLLVGAGVLVVLPVVLLLLRPAPPPPRLTGVPRVQPQYIHSVSRGFRQEGGGTWLPLPTEERWLADGRRWKRISRPDGGVTYDYTAAPGQPGSCFYIPASRQAWLWPPSDKPPAPLSLIDGRRSLSQGLPPTFAALGRRSWHGKQVQAYALELSSPRLRHRVVVYLDPATNLPVREESTYTVTGAGARRRADRWVQEIDYTPFDPARLFDPAKLARARGVTPRYLRDGGKADGRR